MIVKPFAPLNDTFINQTIDNTCKWCGDKMVAPRDVRYGLLPNKPPLNCLHLINPFTKTRCDHKKFTPISLGGKKLWVCAKCEGSSPGRRVKTRDRKIYDKGGPYGNGFFCCIECAFMFAVIVAKSGIFLQRSKSDSHEVVLPNGVVIPMLKNKPKVKRRKR